MKCFRCGICCAKYQAKLSLVEAKRIACGMGITLLIFTERYADPRWPGTRNILLRQQTGTCVFLQQFSAKEYGCLIHLTKPLSCRRFKPSLSQKECQEGLSQRWQLAVGASSEPIGDEDKLCEFQAFLASLE